MLTVAAGFFMASPGTPGLSLAARLLTLAHALVGTALVAGGASAFNQILERDVDARMTRTASRPLPSGRLTVAEATAFASVVSVVGLIYLGALVNRPTALLAGATLVSYVAAYTPLKRLTTLATIVGAVPGALPIVGGWAAAGAAPSLGAWILFGILFLWQLPHFLALSWIYRADYGRAGLRMMSVGDEEGRSTFRQAAINAAALLPISLAPAVIGMSGAVYFFGAVLLSGWFAYAGVAAARERSLTQARRLFAASLAYLPAILALMIVDKLA